jgi:hypothetical protein
MITMQAGIVFDGDEGRLSEEAFPRDFAGDLPEAKAKALYAVQEPFTPRPRNRHGDAFLLAATAWQRSLANSTATAVRLGGGFPCQVLGVDHVAINLYVEEVIQLCS